MTRDFSSFYSLISPYVPMCPAPLIANMVRDVAIHTCERTLAYRYEPAVFNLLPGVHKYAYNKPANTDVHAVFGVLVNDRPLDLLTLDQAIEQYPEWADLYSGQDPSILWSLTPPNQLNTFQYNVQQLNNNSPFVLPPEIIEKATSPRAHTQLTPDEYILLPLPDDQPYRVRMFLGLKPSRSATGMDEAILNDLEESIRHEVISRLMLIPGEPWTDDNKAIYFSRQARYLTNERRARANLGNNRASMHVRFKGF